MTPQEHLAQLIDQHGLTFADCLTVFAARRTANDLRYVAAASDKHYDGGNVEIDDDAIVSGSDDDGDYVLAWVWVDDSELAAEEVPR